MKNKHIEERIKRLEQLEYDQLKRKEFIINTIIIIFASLIFILLNVVIYDNFIEYDYKPYMFMLIPFISLIIEGIFAFLFLIYNLESNYCGGC
jgi:hypothetical protein